MRLVWFEYTTLLLERSKTVCGIYCVACSVDWNYILYAPNVFEISFGDGMGMAVYEMCHARLGTVPDGHKHCYPLVAPTACCLQTDISLWPYIPYLGTETPFANLSSMKVFWKSMCPDFCVHSSWWQEIENNHGMWPIRFLTDGIFTL